MRNVTLHRLLESFTVDASSRLCAEAAAGAEMPFELAEERGSGRVPLYCYRPLVDEFIRSRMGSLGDLLSHADAAHALARSEALDAYLSEHGVKPPPDPRGCAHAALGVFLESMFTERSGFGFEPAAFEAAYAELERAIYEGHCTATVIAPVLGVALDPDTIDLSLGDGLSLICGDALADAPAEAVWGESEEPNVLALLAIDEQGSDRPPVAVARARFRHVLSALRLFERGGYAVGPVGWARTEAGSWRSVSIGVAGRPRLLTIVPAAQEEELRAFCRLVARRDPHPELAWAMARYEMGCERLSAAEALTDYLLALRALLEPEGPASGRLAQRLAVICGRPEGRVALAGRTARAVALERSVIDGLSPIATIRPARMPSSMSWPRTCARSCATCSAATWMPIWCPSPTNCSPRLPTRPRSSRQIPPPESVKLRDDRSLLGLPREAGSVLPARHDTSKSWGS